MCMYRPESQGSNHLGKQNSHLRFGSHYSYSNEIVLTMHYDASPIDFHTKH